MKLSTLAPAALLLLSGSVFAQDTAAGDAAAGGLAEPEAKESYEADKPLAADDSADASASADASLSASDTGEHPDFATADTDKDGLLSIAEIEVAMPGITIVDENGDGFVNQAEVEVAINGLAFESEGYTGGSSLVSEPEYDLIVSKLDAEDDTDVEINVDGDVEVDATDD